MSALIPDLGDCWGRIAITETTHSSHKSQGVSLPAQLLFRGTDRSGTHLAPKPGKLSLVETVAHAADENARVPSVDLGRVAVVDVVFRVSVAFYGGRLGIGHICLALR